MLLLFIITSFIFVSLLNQLTTESNVPHTSSNSQTTLLPLQLLNQTNALTLRKKLMRKKKSFDNWKDQKIGP